MVASEASVESLSINGYYRTTVITYVLSILDARAQRALYIDLRSPDRQILFIVEYLADVNEKERLKDISS